MSYTSRKQSKFAILFVSTISLGSSAFVTSADTALATPTRSAFARADRQLLKKRPLAPKNINLFSPQAYPEATPLVPAQGPPPTVGQVRRLLKIYLKEQFPLDETTWKRGLKLFNRAASKSKIPNPSLRAAMVGLMGTIGEPSIDFILNAQTDGGLPRVTIVEFGPPEEFTGFFERGLAKARIDRLSGQLTILFNPKHQSDNPFLFVRILAHETLHAQLRRPLPPGLTEEDVIRTDEVVLLALVDSLIGLEQLVRHPKLARINTEVARRANTEYLVRFNSGKGARLGLFESNRPGEQVLPGSVIPSTTWFERFEDLGIFVDGDGFPLLRKFLVNISKRGTVVPQNPNFDRATLDFIDQNSSNLSSEELVKVGRVLRLNFNN